MHGTPRRGYTLCAGGRARPSTQAMTTRKARAQNIPPYAPTAHTAPCSAQTFAQTTRRHASSEHIANGAHGQISTTATSAGLTGSSDACICARIPRTLCPEPCPQVCARPDTKRDSRQLRRTCPPADPRSRQLTPRPVAQRLQASVTHLPAARPQRLEAALQMPALQHLHRTTQAHQRSRRSARSRHPRRDSTPQPLLTPRCSRGAHPSHRSRAARRGGGSARATARGAPSRAAAR